MGRLQPWAEIELPLANDNESIFLSRPNPSGYMINISHPDINPLYRKWLEKNNIPPWCPLSDEERFTFEIYICKLLRAGKLKTNGRNKGAAS